MLKIKRAGEKEVKLGTCILKYSYHCQLPFCPISQLLLPPIFFSLPSVSACLVVPDASSLLFVLAFFNVLFLGFVSGQCLCPREFSALNLHLGDVHSSMIPRSKQRARLVARFSPTCLLAHTHIKHTDWQTTKWRSHRVS